MVVASPDSQKQDNYSATWLVQHQRVTINMNRIFIIHYFIALFVQLALTSVTNEIISIFEGLGYSPVCVAKALASCESESATNSLNTSFSEENIKRNFNNKKFINTYQRNCYELLSNGDITSGIRTVYPYDSCRDKKVVVYCDQTTDGGGWTVIQSRDALPFREDFRRTWIEYVLGFGNITGEFWLGLDNIHALVSSTLMELRVDLEDFDNAKRWAKYGVFYVGDSSSKYALNISRYSGDAGDATVAFTDKRHVNGMKFTTHDQDNDLHAQNCAVLDKGGWWFKACHAVNLNGYQHVGHYESINWDGIVWIPFRGTKYSMKKVSMKIRPYFKN